MPVNSVSENAPGTCPPIADAIVDAAAAAAAAAFVFDLRLLADMPERDFFGAGVAVAAPEVVDWPAEVAAASVDDVAAVPADN